MNWLRHLLLIGLMVGLLSSGSLAQTRPVEAAPAPASAQPAVPSWVGLVAMVGGAYLGSVVARRLIDRTWFAYLGARMGSWLGLDLLAGLLGLTEGAGAAVPASRMAPTVPSWTI